MPIMITLNQIKACDPCRGGWDKLLEAQGKSEADNAPFPLASALDSNGVEDTIWALQCQPETVELIPIFAWWCADEVKHLIDNDNDDAASAARASARAVWAAAAGAAELDAEAAGAAANAAARASVWAAAAGAAAGKDERAKQIAKLRELLS